jgi:muconolactone delta-isomerase
MEYLVTMTTRVPDGTSTQEVDDVRSREAAHTGELADQGRVLRLWRPPLAPGEWRTIGLFVADDSADLARTLTAMPLSVWRTDDPTPLALHSNDPGRDQVPLTADSEEYLVTFVLEAPEGTSPQTLEEMFSLEATRARELAVEGHLVRLWTLPGRGRSLGLWQAVGAEELRQILASLPLAGWLSVETVPLTRHPSDPATARDRRTAVGGTGSPAA